MTLISQLSFNGRQCIDLITLYATPQDQIKFDQTRSVPMEVSRVGNARLD